MKENTNHRLLGFAFFLQAVTSLVAGAILLDALIVEGNIIDTLANIASHSLQWCFGILLETITAMGIIFLGVMLHEYLKAHNPKMARLGLSLYIFEGTLLAVSRLLGYTLINLSQEALVNGFAAHTLSLGAMALDFMQFGFLVHMLPFSIGAFLFYLLLDRSRILPRWVTLWGIITVGFTGLLTILTLIGFEVPFFLYLPYAPFEFVVGIWLMVKKYKK